MYCLRSETAQQTPLILLLLIAYVTWIIFHKWHNHKHELCDQHHICIMLKLKTWHRREEKRGVLKVQWHPLTQIVCCTSKHTSIHDTIFWVLPLPLALVPVSLWFPLLLISACLIFSSVIMCRPKLQETIPYWLLSQQPRRMPQLITPLMRRHLMHFR